MLQAKIKLKNHYDNCSCKISTCLGQQNINLNDNECSKNISKAILQIEEEFRKDCKIKHNCKKCNNTRSIINNKIYDKEHFEKNIIKNENEVLNLRNILKPIVHSKPTNIGIKLCLLCSESNIKKIIDTSNIDFREWHYNEIKEIMDIIQKYKNPISTYKFPKPPIENIRINVPANKLTNEELEKALEVVFIRSIISFSFQFSNEITIKLYKRAMVIFCFTMKRYLTSITEEMDKRHLRLLNVIATFDKRYKERLLYGEKKECLTDFLKYPPYYYEVLI